MKFASILFPVLIPAIALVSTPLHSALALSSREVGTIAETITVRIDGQNPGSGILIKKQGNRYTVLTAAHVIATEDEYEIVTPDEESYLLDYKTVKKFPAVDLALVEFTSSKSYSIVEMGDSTKIRSGDEVYVSGFPMPTAAITEPIWTFSPGSITANANRPLADGYALVYTNSTLPGMSGGAVLNEQGKLIGIHGRADIDQQAELSDEVRIKTGFNLAIPINTFRRLVTQVNPQLGFTGQVVDTPSRDLTVDDWVLSSVEKYQNRDFQGAINDLDNAIALNPDFAHAYKNRGNAYLALGNQSKAITNYNKAIVLRPDDASAYSNRGSARNDLGDRQGAIEDFEKAITLQPTLAEGYHNRGVVRSTLGDSKRAMLDFDIAISLKPGYVDAYNSRGNVHFVLGDPQNAIADYSKAIALQPNFAGGYYNRGLVRYSLGDDPKELVADIDKAITLQSDFAEAYYLRGLLHVALAETQRAIADFRSAARLFKAQDQLDYSEDSLKRIKDLL